MPFVQCIYKSATHCVSFLQNIYQEERGDILFRAQRAEHVGTLVDCFSPCSDETDNDSIL